jgi:hypothetical protein
MDLTGFTLPNKFVAVLLRALDELMGTNGFNDEKGVDFYHLKALTQTLVDLYGEKGSQSLMRPANNHVFHELWTSDSRFEFSDEPEFKALDAIKRIEQGMHAFSNVLSDQSDMEISSELSKTGVSFTLEQCPYCWGIEGETPQCAFLYWIA